MCVEKGAGDNYTEVVETRGLLIPNAVTLIKAERGGRREGGLQTTGVQFNSEQKKKKKSSDLAHLAGIQSPDTACNPAKLKEKKTAFVSGGVR